MCVCVCECVCVCVCVSCPISLPSSPRYLATLRSSCGVLASSSYRPHVEFGTSHIGFCVRQLGRGGKNALHAVGPGSPVRQASLQTDPTRGATTLGSSSRASPAPCSVTGCLLRAASSGPEPPRPSYLCQASSLPMLTRGTRGTTLVLMALLLGARGGALLPLMLQSFPDC